MAVLWEIGLTNAAGAAFLALVALVAARFCRRPALLHGLWLLVLIKLVLPPLIPLPVIRLPEGLAFDSQAQVEAETRVADGSGRGKKPAAEAGLPAGQTLDDGIVLLALLGDGSFQATAQLALGSDHPDAGAASGAPGALLDAPPSAGSLPTSRSSPAGATTALWRLRVILTLLGYVWLTGTAAWFLWAGLQAWRFQRMLRFARQAPDELLGHVRRLARQLGLRDAPQVLLMPGSVPPFVWALTGRVRLLFPVELLERLGPEGRDCLLAHELAHIRRKDHWVRWLEVVVLGLYWWYPLVWWARRQLEAHEEDCCDAVVVGALSPRAYASAILETVDFLAESRLLLPVAASGLGALPTLKKRLTRIMQASTPQTMSFAGLLSVLGLGAVLLPITPTVVEAGPKPRTADLGTQVLQRVTTPPFDLTPGRDDEDQLVATRLSSAIESQTVVSAATDVPRSANTPRTQAAQPRRVPLAAAGARGDPADGQAFEVGAAILAASCSPDGKTLALALENHTLLLRDLATGRTLHTLRGHTDAVTCVAFSPDGKTLASGSPDKTLKIWDPLAGQERFTLGGHTSWVYALAFSPNGALLASAGYDRTIRLWEVDTGRVCAVLQGHKAAVRALAFSPDGKLLVSGGGDRTVHVWDVTTRTVRTTLAGHEATVRALAFAPDGATLASGSEDGTVKLWEMATFSEQTTLRRGVNEIWALAFSPQGKRLATGGLDGTLQFWDLGGGSRSNTLRGHTGGVTSLVYSPDGRQLISAGSDRTLRLWDTASRPARVAAVLGVLGGHSAEVNAVAFSPDGRVVLSGSNDNMIRTWDAASGRELNQFRGHTDGVKCAAFSPDGRLAASGGKDHTIRLWDIMTGKEIRVLSGHSGWVYAVVFSPDGKLILSAGMDNSLRLWDATTGMELRRLDGHTDRVLSAALSPNGRQALSGSMDGTARLWEVATGQEIRRFEPGAGWVLAVAFSPDGKFALGSTRDDNLVRLWDVAAGGELRRFSGHTERVYGLAFSPDGRHIATGGYDKTVRLWDLASGKELQRFQGHADHINSVAFSPDGRRLLSGSGDKTIRLWPLTPATNRLGRQDRPPQPK